jgi:hypothetical protein
VAALSELLATLAGEIALAVEALPDSAGPG